MDQLYAYAKSINYRNRDALFRERRKHEGDSTVLTLADIGLILFGGDAFFPDGSKLTLEPAFDLAFDKEHILRACAKCGYLPSTRAALRSPRIRHETVVGEDGIIDLETDPLGSLYETTERFNHEACNLLIAEGYLLASKLKIAVKRVTAAQTRGRNQALTLPNTRERQDLLRDVATAGDFFRVTNGGGPMNSNDAIIAWAQKEMDDKAKQMEK
jgi:hypothetical protein